MTAAGNTAVRLVLFAAAMLPTGEAGTTTTTTDLCTAVDKPGDGAGRWFRNLGLGDLAPSTCAGVMNNPTFKMFLCNEVSEGDPRNHDTHPCLRSCGVCTRLEHSTTTTTTTTTSTTTTGTTTTTTCNPWQRNAGGGCADFEGTCANGALLEPSSKRRQRDHCGSCAKGWYVSCVRACIRVDALSKRTSSAEPTGYMPHGAVFPLLLPATSTRAPKARPCMCA